MPHGQMGAFESARSFGPDSTGLPTTAWRCPSPSRRPGPPLRHPRAYPPSPGQRGSRAAPGTRPGAAHGHAANAGDDATDAGADGADGAISRAAWPAARVADGAAGAAWDARTNAARPELATLATLHPLCLGIIAVDEAEWQSLSNSRSECCFCRENWPWQRTVSKVGAPEKCMVACWFSLEAVDTHVLATCPREARPGLPMPPKAPGMGLPGMPSMGAMGLLPGMAAPPRLPGRAQK